MKINKEKIKQVFLSILAFFLILVGYLNFNYEKINTQTTSVQAIGELQDEDKSSKYNELELGDVQLVNSDVEKKDNSVKLNGIVSNDELSINDNSNLKQEEMKQNNNYFDETRIERNKMYSEMIDTYQKLIDSESTPQDQKAIASQQITNITTIKNGIMIAENLIKNKGFKNVVILVNNEKASVVVESSLLNTEEISKIQNIIEKQLNIDISNISITNK